MDKLKRRERLLIRSERVPRTHLSEEAQLLADGRRLFNRALLIATRTSSIKVWVPLVCSFVLTGYYLYTLHRKTVTLAGVPQSIAEAPAKPVPDTAPPAQSSASSPVIASESSTADAGDNYAEIKKEAEQAHGSQQFTDEARLWQEFMDHAPLPQQACPEIGKAYERIGAIDKSIEAYEKCVSLDPGNTDVLIAYAHALQTKSDFSHAAELYRKCLSKDPHNMDARTGLALVALKQNNLSEAEGDANNVLHVAPDNTDALLIAGIVAWREGRLQDAERIFLKGVGLDDQRADFHAFLGRIEEAERHPQQALQQYDKVLALDPNDAETAERRDRLQGVR